MTFRRALPRLRPWHWLCLGVVAVCIGLWSQRDAGPRVEGRRLRTWMAEANDVPPSPSFFSKLGPTEYDWLFNQALRRRPTAEEILHYLLGGVGIAYDPSGRDRVQARHLLTLAGTNMVPRLLERMERLPPAGGASVPSLYTLVPILEDAGAKQALTLRLAALATNGQGATRRQAIQALTASAFFQAPPFDPATIPTLRTAMLDPDPGIRVLAALALGADHVPEQPRIDAMIAGLADREPDVIAMCLGGVEKSVARPEAQRALEPLQRLRSALSRNQSLAGNRLAEPEIQHLTLQVGRAITTLESFSSKHAATTASGSPGLPPHPPAPEPSSPCPAPR